MTNLAECVGAIAGEVGAGRLGRSLDVVSPLAVDVAELTRGLREQDWLAVSRRELDEYLLPGVLELLAAATDVATLAASRRRRAAAGPAAARRACRRRWPSPAGSGCAAPAAPPPATVGQLWTRWQRTPWGRACTGDVAAGVRTAAFARAWSDVELATLLDHPIVVAWRDRLGEVLERADLLLARGPWPGSPPPTSRRVCPRARSSTSARAWSRMPSTTASSAGSRTSCWCCGTSKSPLASEAEETPRR